MKIRAHAKKAGQYLLDENGRYRQFLIWQALRMKREATFEFKDLTFYSTHLAEEDKRKMTPVNLGFFRYSDKMIGGNGGGDGETISHEFAILALSTLKKMNVVVGNNTYEFNFTELKIDDCRIRFENGNIYIPDLIGFFSEGDYFYKKWGGKVAIEVKVSHECEPEKIRDFEDHGIPILEISISEKMQIERYHRGGEYTEEELESYYKRLTQWFENKVYAKIISDPISIPMQLDIYRKASKEIERLNNIIKEAEEKQQTLNNRLDENLDNIQTLQTKNTGLRNEIKNLKIQLSDEKNIGTFGLLKKLWTSIGKE